MAIGAALFAACTAPQFPATRTRHPNLLIVIPDQMRGQAMGFVGAEPVVTPVLDRFAPQALVLTNAVANYPVCSPTRAMLMSGCWPRRNRVFANCNTEGTRYGYELARDQRCWSDVLHDRGYSLGYIGKWHLDAPRPPYVVSTNNTATFAWNEWCSPDRRHGFSFWHAYGTFDVHNAPEYWTTTMSRDERLKVEQWGPEHEADEAIAFLQNADGSRRAADKPFALVVAMNPPHTPYGMVPQRYRDRYAGKSDAELVVRQTVDVVHDTNGARLARRWTRDYFACITGVDEQFGRILAALDELGLADDTIVLLTRCGSATGSCSGTAGTSTTPSNLRGCTSTGCSTCSV